MKTDFIDDILDTIIDFKQNRSKKPWHEDIVTNLSLIHKRNKENQVFHSLHTIADKEFLIYTVIYNEMFVDMKVYTPDLKDCFLIKLNCRINRTLLSVNELIFEDMDKVSKILDPKIFKIMIDTLEQYSQKNKILGINVYFKNFVAPFNKEIEKNCSSMGYRLINTNIGTSLYKDIKPQKPKEQI